MRDVFCSDRERRLWIWAAAVAVAIYSTLGLGGTLVRIAPTGEQVSAFWLVMFLLAATVVTEGLKIRPRGAEIGIALGVATVSLMLILRLGISMAERTHLLEYGVLAVFVHEALLERSNQGRRAPMPALLAMLCTTLVGAIDEGVQVFLPGRVFDPIDILFNTLAAVTVVTASVVLRWVRRRAAGTRGSWAGSSAQDRR
ncbi:MAG: VanZ family protein [Gemmatimonadota bacterium]